VAVQKKLRKQAERAERAARAEAAAGYKSGANFGAATDGDARADAAAATTPNHTSEPILFCKACGLRAPKSQGGHTRRSYRGCPKNKHNLAAAAAVVTST